MPKHKNQRIGVFVDVQNLYYSAKQFYHSKVNFAHILKKAVAGRNLIRAIAYVIKADIKEESNFFDALDRIGYDVRSKDLQVFYGGAKKGDWDVGIAMDIMRMASKLDVIVLISGDGDFVDLLEHVKALGCRAEVVAFKKTASSRILAEADEFIDLDKDLEKVLIKPPRKVKEQVKKENGSQAPIEAQPPVQEKDPKPEVPKGDIEVKMFDDKFVKPHFDKGFKPGFKPREDFKQRNGTSFKHRDERGYRNQDRSFRKDFQPRELSLIEKVNMEQPDLTKVPQKKIEMPKTPVAVTEQASKEAPPEKKQAKKKPQKESLVKKVLKKVAKKK